MRRFAELLAALLVGFAANILMIRFQPIVAAADGLLAAMIVAGLFLTALLLVMLPAALQWLGQYSTRFQAVWKACRLAFELAVLNVFVVLVLSAALIPVARTRGEFLDATLYAESVGPILALLGTTIMVAFDFAHHKAESRGFWRPDASLITPLALLAVAVGLLFLPTPNDVFLFDRHYGSLFAGIGAFNYGLGFVSGRAAAMSEMNA